MRRRANTAGILCQSHALSRASQRLPSMVAFGFIGVFLYDPDKKVMRVDLLGTADADSIPPGLEVPGDGSFRVVQRCGFHHAIANHRPQPRGSGAIPLQRVIDAADGHRVLLHASADHYRASAWRNGIRQPKPTSRSAAASRGAVRLHQPDAARRLLRRPRQSVDGGSSGTLPGRSDCGHGAKERTFVP